MMMANESAKTPPNKMAAAAVREARQESAIFQYLRHVCVWVMCECVCMCMDSFRRKSCGRLSAFAEPNCLTCPGWSEAMPASGSGSGSISSHQNSGVHILAVHNGVANIGWKRIIWTDLRVLPHVHPMERQPLAGF